MFGSRTTLDSGKIRRILVRSTNWVGDAMLTTPALRAVRKSFSDAEISILAKPWVAPVFYNNPCVDHLLLYDAAGRHNGWSGKTRLSRTLRKAEFDVAILFQNAFEAALLAYLAGIPCRLGYNTDCRRILLTHGVRLAPQVKKIHEVEYYLGILKGVGIESNGRELTLEVTEKERRRADEILKRHLVTEGDTLVGVSPGATYGSAKRWFSNRYAAVCDMIHKAHGARIIVFGGPGEEAVGSQVADSMQRPCVNLCGKTNLREAAALIEKCQLFVTNDSGLMHVATALGVPLVAIFGSTNPITTGPVGSRSRVVRVPIPCSPCLKPQCPEDHQCMDEITVDMVYAVAEELLEHDS